MKYLVELFKQLNENKVKYLVLRNYEKLPYSLNGSDLDILIHKNDIALFYSILERVNEKYNAKKILKYGELTPRVCILGIDENDIFGLQIDVHEGILPYKTVEMFPTDYLFKNEKKFNSIKIIDKDDAVIIAFLKEILNNGYCKPKYYYDVVKMWEKKSEKYKQILKNIYDSNFIEELDALLSINVYDKEKIKKLSHIGRKSLINNVYKKCIVTFNNFKKVKRFFKSPGYVICFIGPDGSGKTTLIELIESTVSEAFHNSIYDFHLKPIKPKTKKTSIVEEPHKYEPYSKIKSYIKLLYFVYQYNVGWIKNILPLKIKSSLIIFDRYFDDLLVDNKRYRYGGSKKVAKFFKKFIPSPDIYFILVADPKIIYERKKEIEYDELKRLVDDYKKLCDGKKYFCIDVSKKPEEIVKEIVKIMMEKMSERYQ
jgi:thymidylate kinase